LEKALSLRLEVVTLKEIKEKLDIQTLPTRKYKMELLSGRQSTCAV
jgi:hypothetical protein